MKPYIIATLTLLLLTSMVQAQKIHPGIKGGLNAYTIVGDRSSEYRPKISYHFGVLTHIHMTDKFALQPEIVYSGQGARINGSSLDLRLKYINVPVLFQYMFGDGFRLQAGPQLGLLASAKTESEGTKTDVKGHYQGADLGLTAGVSYVKPSKGLGFDIRYNQGFTRINESSLYSSYSSGFQLGIFYLFDHIPKVGQD